MLYKLNCGGIDMKRENTIIQNIEFLISMYKKDLEHEEEWTMQELECFENIIIELQTIIDLSK